MQLKMALNKSLKLNVNHDMQTNMHMTLTQKMTLKLNHNEKLNMTLTMKQKLQLKHVAGIQNATPKMAGIPPLR
jgi:hypothetical protein